MSEKYIETTGDSPEEDVFSGNVSIREALQRLRLRLLDLTGRNRLVNFKPTASKSLQFVHSSPEAIFNRLLGGSTASRVTIAPVPEPAAGAWVLKNGRSTRPDAKEHASEVGISTSYDMGRTDMRLPASAASGSQLRALFYADELAVRCRKLEREAKLALEETGANMLYLVLGFLEFPEKDDSDKIFSAPLACIPVRLEKAAGERYDSYSLVFTGEELEENISLREKVKRDFSLILPDFGEETQSLSDYFETVEEVIEKLPRWKVRRAATLTLLSFANVLLVRELGPDNWPVAEGKSALLDHPIVRQVFEGGGAKDSGAGATYASEFVVDEHQHVDLPLIYDADSSQHSALIDALEGKNGVIEGPPGTGKSQTITNLIAAALSARKKVLFMSEKLAALQVVKSRLEQAGLQDFVLELHSNKTSKKQVLEEIERRVNFQERSPAGLDERLSTLKSKRAELKSYADLLNSVVENAQNLTVHQVLWRAEHFRQKCDAVARASEELRFGGAQHTTLSRFQALSDLLSYLAKQFSETGGLDGEQPFEGFYPESLQPEDDLRIQSCLEEYASYFDDFATSIEEATKMLGESASKFSTDEVDKLLSIMVELAPAGADDVAIDALPRLFTLNDSEGRWAQKTLEHAKSEIKKIAQLESAGGEWAAPYVPTSGDIQMLETLRTSLATIGLQDVPLSSLVNMPSRIRELVSAVDAALTSLSFFAASLGLQFDDTPQGLKTLFAVLKSANTAPMPWLHLRHRQLAHERDVEAVARAQREQSSLRARESALNERLYLDSMPEAEALLDAVQTLRQGDAWYRPLQATWRKAVATHRALARNKAKVPNSSRLADLEEVIAWVANARSWAENEDYRRVTGMNLKGEIPFNGLVEIGTWVANSTKSLMASHVSTEKFDPISVNEHRLVRLREFSALVSEQLEQLLPFDKVVSDLLPRQAITLTGLDREGKFADRLKALRNLADTIEATYHSCSEHVRPESNLGSCIDSAKALCEAAQSEVELAGNTELRRLLADRFQGKRTDVESTLAAITYGRLVKKAKLPLSLEKLLLEERSAENYARISSCISALRAGWDRVGEFESRMASFGEFVLGEWTEPDPSVVDYARALARRARHAAENISALLPWAQYFQLRSDAEKNGLLQFVELLEDGLIAPENLCDVFGYRFFASIAHQIFRANPLLSRFSGTKHSTVREDFAALDKEIISVRGRQIAARCGAYASPPAGVAGARVDHKTEMELLYYLMPQSRPRMPVRKMLRQAGAAIQELKPCFMMGPQAVAKFLQPGAISFDMVIMDEASQLKPEEAIGAIARGAQLIVVGDPKQLPPTNFFSRMGQTSDDDEAGNEMAAVDSSSILDVCLSHFQPVRSLRWHYRSRHESLIAFSNKAFYRGNLVVFPSPFAKGSALGLRYNYVGDGIYENQMNQVEAVRVVNVAIDHIRNRADDSLGIVTLNVKQRDLIDELLAERIRSMPEADKFKERWEAVGMGLFVKNLETVQGDERDCIIISTTFGKPKGVSVVRQSFGPISRQGGWRRLNVLFTRARKSVAVFSSMTPEDIVVDSKTPEGTRALRDYLAYARNGILPQTLETEAEPDSDFEVAVIDVLKGEGYEVTPQLGVAGFRLDIAVRHPDYPSTYLAAIECDGATYHSGVSVRDRDRIRQEILESIGWRHRIWRIWSTDWFRNPRAESEKLFAFLATCRALSIPAEYAVEEAIEEQASEPLSDALDQELDFEFDAGEVDLEVAVGDIVTYSPSDSPDNKLTVKITQHQTDPSQGLVARHTPLSQTLLGATVGETVVLRVPAMPTQALLVHEISRQQKQEAG